MVPEAGALGLAGALPPRDTARQLSAFSLEASGCLFFRLATDLEAGGERQKGEPNSPRRGLPPALPPPGRAPLPDLVGLKATWGEGAPIRGGRGGRQAAAFFGKRGSEIGAFGALRPLAEPLGRSLGWVQGRRRPFVNQGELPAWSAFQEALILLNRPGWSSFVLFLPPPVCPVPTPPRTGEEQARFTLLNRSCR